jgi:hypothetical protein
MPRILRKAKVFPCFLLIALASSVVFFETQSGAAAPGQKPPFYAGNIRNFVPQLNLPTRGNAADDGEVQVVVTTYQGLNASSRIVATVANPGAMTSKTTSSLATAPMQPTAAGDIVFSQIYASGGNPGSTYQNNYLELFNRTNNTINISGWRFYIGDATGVFIQAISFTSSRGINIGAGHYLLIRFGPDSSNGAPLPTPDLIAPFHFDPPPGVPPVPDLNLSPSGKVSLTAPGTSLFGSTCPLPNPEIVDFVGYGSTASCFEGGGPAPTLSSTTAALRIVNGCGDTDNNNGDFLADVPNPRNSGSTPNFCSTAPPEIQFFQPILDVTEQSGSIGVVVVRNGNTSGASTVDYTTTDISGANNCNVVSGSASSRCDYIASVGTLKFAAGETVKQINIPLIDDAYSEGTESFSISLSNPTAATLGVPATADIFIHDPDSTNGINPIDQTGFFVRQHYVDFLNREPDAAGNNFWIGEIDNCTPKPQCTEIKRINVSAAFFLSIEFQETGYLAYRTYKAAYGDASGQAMVQGAPVQIPVPMIRLQEFLADSHAIGEGVVCCSTQAQQQLEANKVAYFAAFVSRQRFLNDYPLTMTPAEFVDKLNLKAGNVLSASERDTLVTELQSGQKTRAQVLRAVAEDSDLNNAEKNRAFVLMQFFGYLRRNPNDPQDTDYSGYKFWLDKLNQFNGNFVEAEMVKAFITSIEYRQRFGP